jgi:hypothetical protein
MHTLHRTRTLTGLSQFGTVKTAAAQVSCGGAPSNSSSFTLDLKVLVPPGSDARLAVPLLGAAAAAVTIMEGNATVFAKGAYVPGVKGVTGAVAGPDAITVTHGSGEYMFTRSH